MKLWWFVLAAALVQTPALACECVGYQNDEEMVDQEIKRLRGASVAVDGVVTSSSTSIFGFNTAVVRPRHVWFGTRLKEYRIEGGSNCDLKPSQGQQVRIDLRKLPPRTGFIAKWQRLLFGDTPRFAASGCSMFDQAMRYPKMRQAVSIRSKKGL